MFLQEAPTIANSEPPRVCRRLQLLRRWSDDSSKTTNKFSPEVRDRAVRMALDHEREHPSRWAAIIAIAAKVGCTGQTLNEWLKKAERRHRPCAPGVTTEMAAKLKALERENRELRQANRGFQCIAATCYDLIAARLPI